MPVASKTSSTVAPARIASITSRSRPSCGTLISSSRSSLSRSTRGGSSRRRASFFSSERNAFCSASVKLRPIAIASPTDFMCGGQRRVGGRELLEREPRHLHHHVVEGRLEARRGLLRDVVGDLVEAVTDRHLGRDLRDREPGAFDASALDRETRGFISITTTRPSAGSTANWMLQPPVSTPTARMTPIGRSRMRWYSRSVSVMAGATVIESPVCTPIGSRFSIEHTITALSWPSRITSSSYSFQPRIGLLEEHLRRRARGQSGTSDPPQVGRVVRHPDPAPPIVNDGRTTPGSPGRRRR